MIGQGSVAWLFLFFAVKCLPSYRCTLALEEPRSFPPVGRQGSLWTVGTGVGLPGKGWRLAVEPPNATLLFLTGGRETAFPLGP